MSLFPGVQHLSPVADDSAGRQCTSSHGRTQNSRPTASEECVSTREALLHVTVEFRRYCQHDVHMRRLTSAQRTLRAQIIIDTYE
jgi:hypothetical protein